MAGAPKFSLAFNIGRRNDERIAAFELYRRAFGAAKRSEVTAPGGDLHIVMEINDLTILIAPGGKVQKTTESAVVCEFLFDDEGALRRAYDVLNEGCMDASIGNYPWAPIGALVTDRYGITWWLRT